MLYNVISLINRNVLDVVLVAFEFSTLTGSLKMLLTNISKSSALIFSIMPFVVILKSTGFVIQFTSIVNYVDLLQLERALVELAKVTDMPKLSVDHVVLHGVAEIVFTYVVIVKNASFSTIIVFAVTILQYQ